MKDAKVISTHELLIRFEQLDDGTLDWIMLPDEAVDSTSHATIEELVMAGAPLSALGIRALWDLLYPDIITAALNTANMYLWKLAYVESSREVQLEPGIDETDVVGMVDEDVVVH